ncbi:26S proteasome subunit P45 [Mycena venus]|uniref:26S proteasome subunit P45 n=1 Tax=Mycena venus TaxID=2733690 RepID=A0A8H6YUW2_9AGAR|nr:26S proteasome subunit P45 [Mycena venus]
MHFLSTFGFALACLASAHASTPVIVKPADGTHISPGQAFDFSYQSIADYGVSSYNYSVYLFTTPPLAFMTSQNFGAGHYFGRFAQPNYPGNPNPSNTPPATFVMPDFSKPPGGFGAGASATNATFYLAVFEEYSNGEGVPGNRISFTANRVIYNATSH